MKSKYDLAPMIPNEQECFKMKDMYLTQIATDGAYYLSDRMERETRT
jgi:hypothetical protein